MSSGRFFEDNNFGGRNFLADNAGHLRYLLLTFDFLNGLNFNDILSSIQLRSGNPEIPSTCLLFENARFDGRIKAFAFNADRDIASLPDFNDLTSCILMMDHDANPNKSILPLRQLGGSQMNDAVDKMLSSDGSASRDGDVLLRFTVDLFEVSLFGVDLMLMEIPVKIHTPWPFSDYSAKIRYWIQFFIDDSSKLQGFVAAWGYWIEGGILTGSIEGQLKPKVQAHIGDVESQLSTMLKELDFHRWTDVYLMPGLASVTDDYGGNVNDDCTMVLPFVD